MGVFVFAVEHLDRECVAFIALLSSGQRDVSLSIKSSCSVNVYVCVRVYCINAEGELSVRLFLTL
jgi:hypothetical protein